LKIVLEEEVAGKRFRGMPWMEYIGKIKKVMKTKR
jgi:hypothetical protein